MAIKWAKYIGHHNRRVSVKKRISTHTSCARNGYNMIESYM